MKHEQHLCWGHDWPCSLFLSPTLGDQRKHRSYCRGKMCAVFLWGMCWLIISSVGGLENRRTRNICQLCFGGEGVPHWACHWILLGLTFHHFPLLYRLQGRIILLLQRDLFLPFPQEMKGLPWQVFLLQLLCFLIVIMMIFLEQVRCRHLITWQRSSLCWIFQVAHH